MGNPGAGHGGRHHHHHNFGSEPNLQLVGGGAGTGGDRGSLAKIVGSPRDSVASVTEEPSTDDEVRRNVVCLSLWSVFHHSQIAS